MVVNEIVEDKEDDICVPGTSAAATDVFNEDGPDDTRDTVNSDDQRMAGKLKTTASEVTDNHRDRDSADHKKLNITLLHCASFYFNRAIGSYNETRVDITLPVLRFLLVSKRILKEVYGDSNAVYISRASFYLSNWKNCKVTYYCPNLSIFIWLGGISLDAENEAVLIRDDNSGRCVDTQLVKAIYVAKRLKIPLDIDQPFRTRVVDQLLHDLQKEAACNQVDDSEFIHYGVEPVRLFQKGKDERIPSLQMLDDIGLVEAAHNGQHGENDEFWEKQKKYRVREAYLADAFGYSCQELVLKYQDFLTIYQYLPLPKMLFMELHSACRFQDLVVENVFECYAMIVRGLEVAAPGCKVELNPHMCVNSRSYEHQRDIVQKVGEAVRRIIQLMRAHENLWLEGEVHVFLPLPEENRKADFFRDMFAITPFRDMDFERHSWFYKATVDDLPGPQRKNRFSFSITYHFDDTVFDALRNEDLIVIE
ncbi:unnamed protein product [Bursaphelenchus xylophilus]|uniref:(pine wood nematode) hypothetical protein n=1 Tax=Bursaphelenchus xylophilus TaxID=6326 RepID=A0A7I8WV19_BURXY|nr:unnamed protein product [Bursaphelenchus xylophilus]CAG9116956.1 unnamed protein product [Bursaphelenchus xylophilus]